MTSSKYVLNLGVVSLAGAEAAIAAARTEATGRGLNLTIAVVDRAGDLVSLSRMDGIHVGTVAVATSKAKAAAIYNRPTALFASAVASGNNALLSLPDLVAFPGGLPLTIDGALVGGIGVSGAAPDVDEAIAAAGKAAFDNGSA